MVLDMALLAYIAYQYQYVDAKENGNECDAVDGNSNSDSSSSKQTEYSSDGTETSPA